MRKSQGPGQPNLSRASEIFFWEDETDSETNCYSYRKKKDKNSSVEQMKNERRFNSYKEKEVQRKQDC